MEIVVLLSEYELNIRLLGQSYNIEICLGSSCFSRGNREVVQVIRDYLRKNHLDDKVVLRGARCMNRCSDGPYIIINGRTFTGIGVQDIEKILEKELV
ncbi:MAG: (2Fe-2S) ferredoxin domain-containing protein [Bacteroidales bacterium]|nr:(2Fe-2S) ferredoxin domain-containing protein [Bacteroidales bacterium]